MTIMRMQFAGQIKKAEWRQAGEKQVCEVSICKKVRVKDGDPERFDWLRVTIWSPPEFMAPKLAKGGFIAGSGEFSTRSFTANDGTVKTSMEVKCQSFDVEAEGPATSVPAEAPAPAPRRPAAPAAEDVGSCPF